MYGNRRCGKGRRNNAVATNLDCFLPWLIRNLIEETKELEIKNLVGRIELTRSTSN